jgi:NAD(P)-dependent dehydrogenase (short-subunit alcohol dehydrogenase family)
LPLLLRQGGAVVNLSTGAAHTPRDGWSAYCGSKAALAMLTRSIAKEYGDKGVFAYSLQPGLVDTEMQGRIRRAGINEIGPFRASSSIRPSAPPTSSHGSRPSGPPISPGRTCM